MIELGTFPTFAIGDVPSHEVHLVAAFTEVDAWVTGVTITVLDPYLTEVAGVTGTLGAYGAGTITVNLPTDAFTLAGLYSLSVTFTGDDGEQESAGPVRFVVEDPSTGWLTLTGARVLWADAPEDDAELFELLDAAHTACIEFAPVIAPETPIPSNYRKAQMLQARAIWNSSRATGQNQIGDEFAVTVWPLDWNVKTLLRPKTGVPVMF